jgi:glycosyltransferase involved in cell wall biosynthesis
VVTTGSSWLYAAVATRAPDVPLLRLPLGVDVGRFVPAVQPRGDGRRVLFVGSLGAVKDPVLLLRSFARVRTPDVELRIIGDGPLRPGLERLAAELGIEARTRFLGAVPRDQLPAEYAAADVLAITSRHEAQSMVAVEAAACGVAVVGTRVGVVPELAAAGGALVVPDRAPVTFAAALDAALDPATRARLGAAARACAAHTWDARQTASRLSCLWHDLAREPDGG